MSKRKKLIVIYIIVMTMILVFGAVSIYLFVKKNNEVYNSIDMQMLNNNILEEVNFNNTRMQDISINNVNEIFNIEKEKIVDVIGRVPLFNISAGMYVVFYVDKNNIEYVYDKIIEYGNKYENEWATYMEDQYELVKQRKIGKVENLVYLVISENAEDVLKCLPKNN